MIPKALARRPTNVSVVLVSAKEGGKASGCFKR